MAIIVLRILFSQRIHKLASSLIALNHGEPNMKTPLLHQVLKLALPVAMQSVLVSLLGMSDVFMVTGLGAQAVAAIGLGAKLHFVLIMVMASFGSAVSVLVAQHHGRGNQLASQSILALGNIAGLIILLPISVVFFAFPEQLLSLLSDDALMIQMGTQYLRLTVPLLFFTHVIICFESALRARGETVTPLVLSSVAIVLNIVLNYCLIHGIGIFPELGVNGVALASDFARFAQVVLLLVYLSRYGHAFSMGKLILSANKIPTYVASFSKTAWPLTVNFSVWGIGTFVYHGIAAKMGTDALASLSLISPIEGLYHSLFFGLVTACSVLVGQNLGRDDFDMAKLLAKRFATFAPMGSVVVGLLILATSPLFLPLLLDPSSQLYTLSQQLLWVMCLTFWLKVLNMTVIVGVLRAGGDSKYVLGVDMIAMWAMSIPACLLAAFVFELSYVWVYAMVLVEEVVKATLTIRRAYQKVWLKNLTKDTPDDAQNSSALAA
jgi:putative MATE family efflux protein